MPSLLALPVTLGPDDVSREDKGIRQVDVASFGLWAWLGRHCTTTTDERFSVRRGGGGRSGGGHWWWS